MKRASNNLAAPIIKILFWLLIFASATIVFFRLISRLPNEIPVTYQTPISGDHSPTPIVTAEGKTPQSPVSSTSAPSNPSILFIEDFEDEKTQQVTYSDKEWQIVTDETGNKIYDVDNSKGSGFPGIYLGTNAWKDYETNFRMRIISGSWVVAYFRQNESSNSSYVADIRLDGTSLNYSLNGSGWITINTRQHPLKRNEWYLISIQAKGSEIKITVNDTVVVFTDDTKYTYGRVNIQAGQYTHAQFDDIQIKALNK
jgi:hypothetical protein